MRNVCLSTIALLAACVMLAGCGCKFWGAGKSPKLVLLYIDSKESFDKASIDVKSGKGAVKSLQVELDGINDWATKNDSLKEIAIITYCSDYMCSSSKQAAESLKEAGFANVKSYSGGLGEWSEKKFPIVGDATGIDNLGEKPEEVDITAEQLKSAIEQCGR